MKYLILMQVDPAVIEALTPDEQSAIGAGHQAFIEKTTASGEMLSTHALGDPSQSATIRSVNGTPEVIDGPFAEMKEFMGGYYLIDVESRERAIELARMIPDASIDGLALEVRPVMFSAGANM
ncbi:YciI family protein [Leifsonia poae]|uniref:YciI family protein n=1 Tax=Leifsonia poae TaxID=110933 RepID=UPI001CBF7720|nr:YciI family protein [Leifsonia poae]